MGYEPCDSFNIGCAQTSAICASEITNMVVSTLSAIGKIALLVVAPGSVYILNMIKVA